MALGLDPAEIRHAAPGEHLSASEVIQRLNGRVRAGKSVAQAKVSQEDMVLNNAACRRFGSYGNALQAAGFDPVHVRLKTPKYEKKHFDELKAAMTKVASTNGHERAEAANEVNGRYGHLVSNRLGNWKKACRKFGVKLEALAVYPYATKEDVLYGLRQGNTQQGCARISRI
jgi:hypothetical protein